MESLCHDLDAAPDAKILYPDLPQRKVEMAEHGVEERLRQGLTVRFAAQAVDDYGRMQCQGIEASIERVGNSAVLVQFGRPRTFSGTGVEQCSDFFTGRAAAKQSVLPGDMGPG